MSLRARARLLPLIAALLAATASCTAPVGDAAPDGARPSPDTAETADSAGTPGSANTPDRAAAAVPPPGTAGPYPVVDVVDGDTLRVSRSGRTVTVRLLGVDTPELRGPRRPVECFAREASAHAHRVLGDRRRVYLELDPSQPPTDRYGRTLAYVWLPGRPASLFNEGIIHAGFAVEYTYRLPYRYQRRFQAAEADARRHDRGLWNPRTCAGDPDRPAARGPTGAAPTSGGAADYATCAAARAAGAAPLRRGEPSYRPTLDRDGDGVACE